MSVGGNAPAVDGLEAGRPGDRDVLAEPRGQLDALLLELRVRLDPLRLHEVEHVLAERLELVALRDGLRLATDCHHRPAGPVVRQAVADEPFGRRAVGALLRLRHPLFREGAPPPPPCRRSSPGAHACSPSSPPGCARGARGRAAPRSPPPSTPPPRPSSGLRAQPLTPW